jgi:hypothetical protein
MRGEGGEKGGVRAGEWGGEVEEGGRNRLESFPFRRRRCAEGAEGGGGDEMTEANADLRVVIFDDGDPTLDLRGGGMRGRGEGIARTWRTTPSNRWAINEGANLATTHQHFSIHHLNY